MRTRLEHKGDCRAHSETSEIFGATTPDQTNRSRCLERMEGRVLLECTGDACPVYAPCRSQVAPTRMSEEMPDGMSEDVPERMSDRMSGEMQRMSERMSGDVPKECQKDEQKMC